MLCLKRPTNRELRCESGTAPPAVTERFWKRLDLLAIVATLVVDLATRRHGVSGLEVRRPTNAVTSIRLRGTAAASTTS